VVLRVPAPVPISAASALVSTRASASGPALVPALASSMPVWSCCAVLGVEPGAGAGVDAVTALVSAPVWALAWSWCLSQPDPSSTGMAAEPAWC